MKKICIVGPGRVGESTAQLIAKAELCRELVILGRDENKTKGIALDIQETAPLFRFDTRVYGSSNPNSLRDADLVIFTAGLPRKPGMSRDELIKANAEVLQGVVEDILVYAPQSMLLLVTNPVDVLTYRAWRQTGWKRNRIFGLSGVLDAARMASFIALETGFSTKDITTLVIGGHGDAMLPLTRYACINGVPIEQFLDAERIEKLVEHTRIGGAEILALKKTSSAYDSPAAAVATMVDAIARNRRRVLPCVAILDGEYQQRELALGVPVILGAQGIERVIELPLTQAETTALEKSAAQVRAVID
ncbi:MAG: malate dehydrogenase [Thiohalomonadales bacterium]